MISTAGALFAISHLGLLGYLIDRKAEPPSVPTINLPRGPYSSYTIEAGKEGYRIEYRANDPKVLESERSLDLDKSKKGFLGGSTEQRIEYRRDQYTMDGTRNIGGAIDAEGKSNAKSAECIAADAGARAQGAMAGSLQLHPVSARHHREVGITNVEVQQVPAAGVGHQQQAAFIQPPELAYGQAWCALVLG